MNATQAIPMMMSVSFTALAYKNHALPSLAMPGHTEPCPALPRPTKPRRTKLIGFVSIWYADPAPQTATAHPLRAARESSDSLACAQTR